MEKLKNNKIQCPVCGSEKYSKLDYGGYEYKGIKMPLVWCSNCSLSYIVHNLSAEEINGFYNESIYFDSEYAGGATKKYIDDKKEQEQKALKILDIINKYHNGKKLLEIGSAGGFFLDTAKNKCGFDVFGVEVSKEMCFFARGRGLNVYCGTIYNMPMGWGEFDVIYMGDVLEHIPEPNKFISLVKNKLNKNGLLVLELPLTYNPTLSGIIIGIFNMLKGNLGYKYFLPSQHRVNYVKKSPYHLVMFNKKSINYFLKNNDFVVQYLKEYEGIPKEKFKGKYELLKNLSSILTTNIYQSLLGDRMIVVAKKK